jgi:hypothetical protein
MKKTQKLLALVGLVGAPLAISVGTVALPQVALVLFGVIGLLFGGGGGAGGIGVAMGLAVALGAAFIRAANSDCDSCRVFVVTLL